MDMRDVSIAQCLVNHIERIEELEREVKNMEMGMQTLRREQDRKQARISELEKQLRNATAEPGSIGDTERLCDELWKNKGEEPCGS